MKLRILKTIDIIFNHRAKDITEGNRLIQHFFINHKIEILKVRLSFTSIPKNNIFELGSDIYNFIGKLRLTYYFHDSTNGKKSIVKDASTITPKTNENQELWATN